jgi:predicted transcriptional regulator
MKKKLSDIINEVITDFEGLDDSSPTMAGFGERLRSISEERKIGININDDAQPFSQQILNGEKTIETRNSPTLRPYVGKRVGIVSTGKNKKAMLVGFVDIDDEFVYDNAQAFDADIDKHLVTSDSPFYIKGIKYGYHLSNPQKITPVPVESRGYVSRKIDA